MINNISKKGIVLSAMILTAAMAVTAQNSQITFSRQDVTVRQAVAEIMEQTEYVFVINHNDFNIDHQVLLSDNTLSLTSALDQLLADTNREYLVKGHHVILSPTPPRPDKSQSANPPKVRQNDFERDIRNYEIRREALDEPLVTFEDGGVRYDTIRTLIPHDGIFIYPDQSKIPAGFGEHDAGYPFAPHRPSIALKTNLLYGLGTLTPNLGIEVSLGQRTSIELMGSWNPWNRKGLRNNNKKLTHWIVKPEFRYWLSEPLNGHFFGIHAFYWRYNIGGHEVPLLFEKEFRNDGNAVGVGVSYGYHWMWSHRWGMEFNIGFGYAHMQYYKSECARCSDKLGDFQKSYFGPTSAGIKLVFIIK